MYQYVTFVTEGKMQSGAFVQRESWVSPPEINPGSMPVNALPYNWATAHLPEASDTIIDTPS